MLLCSFECDYRLYVPIQNIDQVPGELIAILNSRIFQNIMVIVGLIGDVEIASDLFQVLRIPGYDPGDIGSSGFLKETHVGFGYPACPYNTNIITLLDVHQ